MFPESLQSVFGGRSEFVVGQRLPIQDGSEALVYLVLDGCVVLTNRNGATAAVFWPGDLLILPLEPTDYPTMSLKAIAQTTCLCGRKTELLAENARQLDVAAWVWRQSHRRELELHRRLELLTAEAVERRILLTVADLADRASQVAPGKPMPLAQNEIAELAGATRETTSTLLNRLKRQGFVNLGRRHVHVAAPDLLRNTEKFVAAGV